MGPRRVGSTSLVEVTGHARLATEGGGARRYRGRRRPKFLCHRFGVTLAIDFTTRAIFLFPIVAAELLGVRECIDAS